MGREEEIEAIADAFCQIHPDAAQVHEWDMKGWAVRVQEEPEDWKGTMDPTRLMVFPLERSAGITVHVWDPRNPALLKQNEAWLKQAGFKVMVGCLQWNRKSPVDLDALQRLFEETV